MQKWYKGPRMLTGPGGLIAAVALILALGACYPGDISSVEETDVVLTIHSGNDFSGFNTYAMPDTIVDVCTNVDDPECENAIDIDHSYDDEILAQVAARMQAYGYVRIPIDQVDENDQVTMCNLIVSTTSNNEPMNRSVSGVADKYLSGNEITEGLLNNIEVGIRIGPDWAVREGLEEGDRVIVHGLQLVRQGMKVNPEPLAAAD